MNKSNQESPVKSEVVTKTIALLNQNNVDSINVLKVIRELKKELAFGYARKLIIHSIAHPTSKILNNDKIKLNQQLALCTYKDPDLAPAIRLKDAFEIINIDNSLKNSNDQESLGIAGAICKREWELYNKKESLERALIYYQRGYKLCLTHGWDKDRGYNAINVAYVLDKLAYLEKNEAIKANGLSQTAEDRISEALDIRGKITENLPPLLTEDAWLGKEWWFLLTLAEAYFGLAQYNDAKKWLKKANVLEDVPEWQRESSARQLASLLRLQAGCSIAESEPEQKNISEAKAVLCDFLDNDASVESVLTGKIGLALSGGGFRASLYHIGVLARLAEQDTLRQIEVISCVSGGSIIGAHYYLEVKNLLETKGDDEIKIQDYIDIVKRIEKEFLAGVKSNIRTRIFTNPIASLKMMFLPSYTRTKRLGELYEDKLFSKVTVNKDKKPLYFNKLTIKPKGEVEDFAPKNHNWKRKAKAPILILNATSINTGHNWQFTATWMGEPPAGIDTEIDANYRLRRLYYPDAPIKLQNIRLGDAVAASSGVPGVFEPLELAGLYPNITVQLVDGGVYDNQGTAGLLDQNCDIMLVSDASGQMSVEDQPKTGVLAVPLRTSSILQTRVRSAQYQELDARLSSGLLSGMMYIHLKKDLNGSSKDWVDSIDPTTVSKSKSLTDYGINREYQTAIANIRTDLDSFTNNEAHALMLSGYKMTEHYCPKDLSPISEDCIKPKWVFKRLESELKKSTCSSELLKQLKVGKKLGFKVWFLSHVPKVLLLIILPFIIAPFYLWPSYRLEIEMVEFIITGLSMVASLTFLGLKLFKKVPFIKSLKKLVIGSTTLFFGTIIGHTHIQVFDRLFLYIGSKLHNKKSVLSPQANKNTAKELS
jgi:predicted acylesterase/phospholipase RssA